MTIAVVSIRKELLMTDHYPPVFDDSMAQLIETTRARLLHALEVFPFISQSMLHQAIGTSTPGQLWKPVFDGLVEDGSIVVTEHQARTPSGRAQSYTIYHLPKNEYTFGTAN